MHALQANDTILLESLSDALMVVLECKVEAASTIIAMKVLAFTDATNATAITVIDSFLFVFVVIETADLAEVLGKIFLAIYARLRLDLLGLAPEAFNVRHLVSVHLVILLRIHFVLKEQFVMA